MPILNLLSFNTVPVLNGWKVRQGGGKRKTNEIKGEWSDQGRLGSFQGRSQSQRLRKQKVGVSEKVRVEGRLRKDLKVSDKW